MKDFKLIILFSLFSFLLYSQNEVNTFLDFTISFGSCNKQDEKNFLWKELKNQKPDLWIWGGDNIYADTDNMQLMQKMYTQQQNQDEYQDFIKDVDLLATWDDHDYGVNDGGVEFSNKDSAQQLFLDFIKVDKNDEKRNQKGIYTSKEFKTDQGKIKVIVLDTRYFRTALTKANKKGKRYVPNIYGDGTILGSAQWEWFEKELSSSNADFNIIVSSIQIISSEHGFEKWANFPHELDKLYKIIEESNAKGVILLSGDRHLSEFSKIKLQKLNYPLIDFTSSGLTHAYTSYTFEPNKYRIKDVVSKISFGILKFNFKEKAVLFQMWGKDNTLQQQFLQKYP